MSKKVIFATTNSDKLREAQNICDNINKSIHLVSLDKSIPDIPEIQGSLKDIAEKKAKDYFEILNTPLIGEDTGFTIDKISFPGPYIKDFLKKNSLDSICDNFRGCCSFAECYMVYIDKDKIKTSYKKLNGKISNKIGKEIYGFAWDRIFIPDGYDIPLSEIKDKNKISPRYKCIEEIISLI